MEDDTTSLCAALFGLAGFEVLAAADAGGELELLVQTTADLVGCPSCGAVARAKDRRPTWVRISRSEAGRWCCAGGSGSGSGAKPRLQFHSTQVCMVRVDCRGPVTAHRSVGA